MLTGMQIRKELFDKIDKDIEETEKKLKLLNLMRKRYKELTSEHIMLCRDIFAYLNSSELTIYKDE